MRRETIITTREDAVAIVTLNRPAARNALSSLLVSELSSILSEIEVDPTSKVIVLTGAGPHFAAGADLTEMATLTVGDVLAADFAGCCERLGQMRKPIIAAVDGYALGGGCELVEMCDIVIASDRAKFGHPEVTVGTLSGCGGTQRLPRIVGKHWAMDILLSGRQLSASEAYQSGLVSRVVAQNDLMAEAMSVARRIASLSAPVVQMIKAAVLEGADSALPAALSLERKLFHLSFALGDRAEGMNAFVEKRTPQFQDR